MAEGPRLAIEPIIEPAAVEDAIERARDALAQDSRGCLAQFSWPVARERIASALGERLNGDALLWLAKGWSLARELRAFKDPEKYPPGVAALLKLGRHELKGTLHPRVAIRCEGAELATVTFDVPITGAYNAVTLTIQDGKVTAFGGGECVVSLRIEYRGVDISGQLPVKTVTLPGNHVFREPLPIP